MRKNANDHTIAAWRRRLGADDDVRAWLRTAQGLRVRVPMVDRETCQPKGDGRTRLELPLTLDEISALCSRFARHKDADRTFRGWQAKSKQLASDSQTFRRAAAAIRRCDTLAVPISPRGPFSRRFIQVFGSREDNEKIADRLETQAGRAGHMASAFRRGGGRPKGEREAAFRRDFEVLALSRTGTPLDELGVLLFDRVFGTGLDLDSYVRIRTRERKADPLPLGWRRSGRGRLTHR